MKKKCYFLLYKSRYSQLMWVIDVMDTPYEFEDFIKEVKSEDEKYYIVLKRVVDLDEELSYKRFTIFNKTIDCIVLYETKLL